MDLSKTEKRVFIRSPEARDAEEFVRKTRRSIAMHRPWVYPATTARGYLDYLARIDNDRNAGFMICSADSGEMVGLANVSEIVRGSLMSAYVGYWGIDGYQGSGYMTTGLALVFDQAATRLNLHRLEVNIQPGNLRSVALARRLGLTKEGFSEKYLNIGGVWKDHERWALLLDGWIARGGAAGVLAGLREEKV